MKAPFHVGGQYYTIAGTTEPGATVFINDEEVDVESSGSFQKLIALEKLGPNSVVIKAVNRLGTSNAVLSGIFLGAGGAPPQPTRCG